MNYAKAKGTLWEGAVRDYLRNFWPNVERLPTEGAKDRGDLVGIPGLVIECKAVSDWSHLGVAIAEAEKERRNAGAKIGLVWRKRVRKTSAADGYVVMTGATLVELLKEAGY